MQELLPADQAVFNKYKESIREVYKHHGFLEIETPLIDRAEILFAKAGGETEKQIYKVIKTEETAGDADQALRFDHTVPLARYVAEHESDLAFPFKVSQVGRNYRGERAQKGRFREFYQLDIDVIGRNNLPVEYDAEVILTLYEALDKVVKQRKLVRVSNRKILSGFLEGLNLNHLAKEIFNIIDHAEKVPPEVTDEKLKALNIGDENIEKVNNLINIAGEFSDVERRLGELGISNAKFNEGLEELRTVFSILGAAGLEDKAIVDLKIIRGLDYYTGTVFETILPDHKEIGSICSGGRYENLAGFYTDQILPGVGGSIGLTRLFYVLRENNLIKEELVTPVDLMIIPIEKTQRDFSFRLAETLRKEGRSVDLLFSEKKLGDRIKYATKVAKKIAIVGEDEEKSGEVSIKDLATGESEIFRFKG